MSMGILSMLVPSQELGDPARVRFLVDEHKRTAAN